MTTSDSRTINYRVIVAFLAFFTLGIPAGLISVAWVYMQSTFGVTIDYLGILAISTTAGRFAVSIFGGPIIDRVGLFRYIFVGCIVSTLSILGVALAPTWIALVIVVFGIGAGFGTLDIGLNTTATTQFSRRQMNWAHASFGIGLTISPMYFTFMVSELGFNWQSTYVVSAFVFVLLTIAIYLRPDQWTLPKRRSVQLEMKAEAEAKGESTDIPFPRVGMLLSVLLFFFYAGVEAASGQLTNSLFVDGRGIPESTSGLWISFYWGTFTVTRLVFGIFADDVGTRPVIRFSYAVGMMGLVLLGLNINTPLILLGLMLMGISLAVVFPTLMSDTPNRVGLAFTATAIGFQATMAGLSGAVIPGSGAVLARQFGLEIIPPFLFAVFAIYAIVFEILQRHLHRQTP